MIAGKYGEEEGGWCSSASREGHGVGHWKAFKNGWTQFSKRVLLRCGTTQECGSERIGGVERIP